MSSDIRTIQVIDLSVSFTIYKSTAILSKKIDMDASGNIIKTPAAQMTTGTAQRLTMDFTEFGKALSDTDETTAFGYGLHDDKFGKLVKITVKGRENESTGILSRSQKYLEYRPRPGIVMNDHDPHPSGPSITPEELRAILSGIDPGFADAASWVRGSLSAGIHRPGERSHSGKGFHIYNPVLDASDIPRFGEMLFKRLWLAKHGYIAISAAGTFLVRSVLDVAVYRSERLDFVGRPVVGEGLVWTPPEPVYREGGYLDTRLLPDLSADEEQKFTELVAEAKRLAEPERAAIREAWQEKQINRMVDRGIPEGRAREALERLAKDGTKFVLYSDFVLDFVNHGAVTVDELLRNPKQYDGKALGDPFEGTEYGATTATFYANDETGRPCINSHAHGGIIYYPCDATTSCDADPMKATVKRLAKLSPFKYDKVRKDEAKRLEIRTGTLDTAVKSARNEEVNDSPFEEVEPWPEPVDGAALLATIAATIRRFIICEQETAYAVALWVALTWFVDVVQVAPLAVITAPEKRCGKSILLSLIGRLVPRPLMSSSISPSALFRSIDAWQPTLLIDEVDACLKDNEELRGLINCGHTRDSAFTIRCVGDDHTPKKFNVWGAKALSGIGHVADTLMDRSIVFKLRRKLSHESVERIRHAETSLFSELSSKLARFADDNAGRVRLTRPELPLSLNDRAQDNWEPLLAIAMVAGGDWFKIGTVVALKLSGGESMSLAIGTELLVDIKEVFERKKVDRITTAELIKELVSDDEKQWATFVKGFQITPRQIATKLKGYGVQSKTIRIGVGTAKGYEKDQFKEAFSRYIPVTPVANVIASQTPPGAALAVTDNPLRYPYEFEKETRKRSLVKACDVVTDMDPVCADINTDDDAEYFQ